MITKIKRFLATGVWRIRLKHESPARSFAIRQLRIILLAIRGFHEDTCQLKASALTFNSLLSIVPVVAIAFGVAKGFGYQEVLKEQLLEKFPTNKEVLMQVMNFALALLETTKGGVVAGFGLLVLFYSVIKVLGNIEDSFNDIWGVEKSRSWMRTFSDYTSVILLAPFLLIMSGSVTVFISTQVQFITERFSVLGSLAPLVVILLKCLPYLFVWTLFTFVYIFLPNGKVNFASGLLAGILAGTVYELVQWGYITFQVGVSRYNAIYGSFAALPLFLAWMQVSWFVVLFGAEISFAHQNVHLYEFEPDCRKVSLSFKKLISLRITQVLVKNFSQGKSPLTAASIAQAVEMPMLLVHEILLELVESGIISGITIHEHEGTAYQPARDTDNLTIQYVIDALEKRGVDAIPALHTPEIEILSESLKVFNDSIAKSPANKLLKIL